MNLKHVFDLSHTLMPGREEYRLEIDTRLVDKWEQFAKYPRIGDSWYIVSEVTLNTHTGTHVEFPYHHVKDGQDAATFPLEHLFGPGAAVDVSEWGDGQEISLDGLKRVAGGRIQPGDILYCYTGCDRFYRTEYQHRRPSFSTESIAWLIREAKIKIMGIDASGIEPRSPNGAPYPGQPNHEALLQAGIPLIEYMTNLEPLINKRFLTFVLPLKVTGAEAFPVRVIAVEEET
jgi:arylformamidase